MSAITEKALVEFSKEFAKEPRHLLAMNAVSRTDIAEVALKFSAFRTIEHQYSTQVPVDTKVTAQNQSGRCWLFAGLNVMRLALMHKYDIKEFEFSQAHLFFWDKLEKANYFLESILKTTDEPLNGRLMMHLLQSPLQDGGQWDMFVNLVNKYGLMPKSAMPETFSSSNSAKMNWVLTYKLREFAKALREAKPADRSKLKTRQLSEFYRMLVIHLGEPPKTFTWQFRNSKNKFQQFANLTPQAFAKLVPYDVNDKVCLINAPTKDKPYNKLYTVDYLGNVVEGYPVRYINVPVDVLKEVSVKSLIAGEAVWFGCDVGKFLHKNLGVMDTDLLDYELVFNTSLGLDKEARLDYGESRMSHAMVFSAVDLAKKKPIRWRVENSWGETLGNKGFFSMTDAWFDEYMYEVVVDKKFIPKNLLKILTTTPTHLAPWDPMGSLA